MNYSKLASHFHNAAFHCEVAASSDDPRERARRITAAQGIVRKLAKMLDTEEGRAGTSRKGRSAFVGIHVRSASLESAESDAPAKTLRALIATGDPNPSLDLKTGRSVLEVYLMDGMEDVDQVPLIDTHKRDSINSVLGSVRDIAPRDDELYATLYFDDARAWSKTSNGHVTDVSCGFQPLKTVEIKPGKSSLVNGRVFTAPANHPLLVHTAWRLREVSLTAIGADERAKILT